MGALFIHRVWIKVFVMIACVGAAGCFGDDDLPWQAYAAEDARELALLYDVEVIEMTREEFSAQAAERAAGISDAYLEAYAETYGRLGFFDPGLDLRPIIAGSSSDWVGATYSPTREVVTLVGEARDDTIVHEFVHALQDQHFDLVGYDLPTSDAFLSRRAVVEGDAVLAEYRFTATQEGRVLSEYDWQGMFDAWREYTRTLVVDSEYPPVFLDYVSFVYAYGFEYCANNLMGVSYEQPTAEPAPHDWGRQDELFLTRAPATTQEILTLGGLRSTEAADEVVSVGLRDVPAGLQELFELVDWDVLGEWYVYLLLLPLELDGTIADARALAARWDGDTVLFARQYATGEVVAVWASAWDDEQSALDMAAAMRAIYGAPEPQEGFASTAADGELVWIEPRGARLVVAKNPTESVAPELVDAAFASESAVAPRLRPSLSATIELIRRSRWRHHHEVPRLAPTP